jgi:PIN domain
MAAEAQELARHWQVYGVIVMPDTNVLLHATEFFDELDWPGALEIDSKIYLVIPMVVIDELDSHRRGTREIRSIAGGLPTGLKTGSAAINGSFSAHPPTRAASSPSLRPMSRSWSTRSTMRGCPTPTARSWTARSICAS